MVTLHLILFCMPSSRSLTKSFDLFALVFDQQEFFAFSSLGLTPFKSHLNFFPEIEMHNQLFSYYWA